MTLKWSRKSQKGVETAWESALQREAINGTVF
jgi:hypothetical protein